MDKIVRNDIRINLISVEETKIFNKPYDARMIHDFLPRHQQIDIISFLEI